MTVYLNSRLVADDEARIDPTDRGLTLGDGLFETIAVRGRRAARGGARTGRGPAGAWGGSSSRARRARGSRPWPCAAWARACC